MLYPLSAYIIWPVIADDILLNKNDTTSPTSSVVTFLLIGAFSSTTSNMLPKSFIPFADNVFIGSAYTAFTLIFFFPRLSAKYLTLVSNAAFATPITLYPGSTFVEP